MVVGEALREQVGAGGAVTVMVRVHEPFPPAPVKVPVYVVVTDGVTTRVPDVPTEPTVGDIDPPVELVDDHVSVVDCPCTILVALAEIEHVAAGAVTEAVIVLVMFGLPSVGAHVIHHDVV